MTGELEAHVDSKGFSHEARCMTFRIMGIEMAIDMELVGEMLEMPSAEEMGIELVHFHEKVPFVLFGPVRYESPRVLLPKEGDMATGLVIDRPEGIMLLSADSIRPLPLFMAKFMESGAIWGVALKGEDQPPVLLVDIYRMLESGQEVGATANGAADGQLREGQ